MMILLLGLGHFIAGAAELSHYGCRFFCSIMLFFIIYMSRATYALDDDRMNLLHNK